MWEGAAILLIFLGVMLWLDSLRAQLGRYTKGRAPHTDWRQGLFPGVLVGFVRGATPPSSDHR